MGLEMQEGNAVSLCLLQEQEHEHEHERVKRLTSVKSKGSRGQDEHVWEASDCPS